MNTASSLKEYVEIPMKELVESSSNPRKSFGEAALDELAASIRTRSSPPLREIPLPTFTPQQKLFGSPEDCS